MRAEAMSLTFLGNEGCIRIPFFQRGYVWNVTNWEELFTDLMDFEKSHFLGSLILKQLEIRSGKPKEALVIDGQQRLTTLSLLLCALYHSFDHETKENCLLSYTNLLFYKKRQTDKDYLVKIEHSKIDRMAYQKVINNELTESEYDAIVIDNPLNKNGSKHSKILKCFKYFTEKLKDISLDERSELFDRLLDQQNRIIVVIDLSEKEDEQAIFDSINSAGMRLSSADIIKNALFQKAIEIFDDSDKVEELYSDYWEAVFSPDSEAVSFWETPRATGRLMRDNIEILLHSVSVIKNFFDPDKNTLSDLSSLYKAFIAKLTTKNELESFIKEISKYAKLFREKILVFDNSALLNYEDNQTRLFHVLAICEISTFHPYILSLYYKYDENISQLERELAKVESLVIRRMITNADTKSYNKMCKDFIKDNSAIDIKIAEQPDSNVKTGLSNISNKSATLLLFWIELYRRSKDTKESLKDLKYNYWLEHVLPQKWEEYWSGVHVTDLNGNIIVDKELAKKERNTRIYSIGNMTLLNSSLNISLRNFEFERKIKGEGRKKGIEHYADLSITKFDIIEAYKKGDVIWNETKINARTESLAQDILTIW